MGALACRLTMLLSRREEEMVSPEPSLMKFNSPWEPQGPGRGREWGTRGKGLLPLFQL